MDVGVSMFTQESYRYAEFYNVSVNSCPASCEDAAGKQVSCGIMTTACGDVMDCGDACSGGGVCDSNVCMDCPELVVEGTEMADWECGLVTMVCTDPDGRSIQVHRDVWGPGPTQNHKC